jgi:hypothetical protein
LGDALLKLAEAPELLLTTATSTHDPRAVAVFRLGSRARRKDLEEEAAVRALHGRAALGDERLVELVLRPAAFAGDVHRPART